MLNKLLLLLLLGLLLLIVIINLRGYDGYSGGTRNACADFGSEVPWKTDTYKASKETGGDDNKIDIREVALLQPILSVL